jgi:ribosomal protein S13
MSRILEFFIVIMKRYFQDGKTWVSMRKRVKEMNDEEVKKLIKEIEEDHTEDFVKHKKIEIIQQI